MKITTVLFDLDGTLLPMDQEVFVKAYFSGLAKRLSMHGYEPNGLIKAVWTGTKAMIKNDGSKNNEKAFWETFTNIYGEKAMQDLPHFDAFYEEDFDKVALSCGFNEKAKKTVDEIKALGLRMALATNPIFPAIATQKRIAWAGLSHTDFELYTTYENCRYCKPNLSYYQDILSALNVRAEECLMVGNDVSEDMVVKGLGMQVFLLTDCLINKNNEDISAYPNGSFDDLLQYVKQFA